MNYKLTLEFSSDVNIDEHTLQYLLMDAFAEFQVHRTPELDYVNKRYPDNPDYAWLDRAKKVKEVIQRCRIAEDLHRGFVTLETLPE